MKKQARKQGVRDKGKIFKKLLKTILTLMICAGILLLGTNLYILLQTKKQFTTEEELIKETPGSYEAALIFGAGIWGDEPSHVLKERLDFGISLYKAKVVPKLLMSGDHGTQGHNEVQVMKNYAIEAGVPEEDIFMDHAGFSTYDSVMRAKMVFQCQKIILVSQSYHLSRAVFLANQIGISVKALPSDRETYQNMPVWQVREVFARTKDFFFGLLQPATFAVGEVLPIQGDGRQTND